MSIKNRRQVRCTLCTPYRWKGNAKNRFKLKEAYFRELTKKEINEATKK